jgi:PTS system mannose-specific IIA component
MPGLLVVTHGHLAEVLLGAARTIVGSLERAEAVSIGWDDDVADATARIQAAMHRVGDSGVLILTDIFGATPSNIALSLLEPGRVEVVTGVNLPMLIKFTKLRGEMALGDLARRIADQGRQAIHVASDILEGRPARAPGDQP